MDYQKIYNQIIERAKNRKLEGYKEKHHIIPKCLGGDNSKENLVELTAREHFLCHKILCILYPNNHKLLWALWLMVIGKKKWKHNEPYKISSKEYETLKTLVSNQRKGKNITQNHKSKIGNKNSKPVCQYNQYGVLLKTYSSAAEAERIINNKPNEHWKKLQNNIDACCRLKQKSAYGFIWKYKGEIINLDDYNGSINKKKGKKIIQYDLEGKVMNIFKNKSEAQQFLKISLSLINNMLENHIIGTKLKKPVNQIDVVTGKIIKSFSSLKETEKENFNSSSISNVLNNKSYTSGGYKWEYDNKNDINFTLSYE